VAGQDAQRASVRERPVGRGRGVGDEGQVVAMARRRGGGGADPGEAANAAESAALRGQRFGQGERLGARLSPRDGVARADVAGQVQREPPIALLRTIEA
jgi:hypothetical protein